MHPTLSTHSASLRRAQRMDNAALRRVLVPPPSHPPPSQLAWRLDPPAPADFWTASSELHGPFRRAFGFANGLVKRLRTSVPGGCRSILGPLRAPRGSVSSRSDQPRVSPHAEQDVPSWCMRWAMVPNRITLLHVSPGAQIPVGGWAPRNRLNPLQSILKLQTLVCGYSVPAQQLVPVPASAVRIMTLSGAHWAVPAPNSQCVVHPPSPWPPSHACLRPCSAAATQTSTHRPQGRRCTVQGTLFS